MVALLAAGAVVGRFVVPTEGPATGSKPPEQAMTPGPTELATPSESPASPALPTLPARPADQLAPWAQKIAAAIGIPVVAVQAYGYAQLALRQTDPGCGLGWTTLAGIGEVESRHGQAGGAILADSGRSSPPIAGPLLDGKQGRALVRDTDIGAFDGDATYDRAMGPLHLMPAAWRAYAVDADNDGVVDPFDLDDAALSLAHLLCSGSEDLTKRAGWNSAIARYRDDNGYVRSVFDAADDYGQRTKNIV